MASSRASVSGPSFTDWRHVCTCRDLWNQTGNVRIEVEGERGSLDRFLDELTHNPPPLAHIDRVSWSQVSPRGDGQFRIEASESRSRTARC